MSTDTAFDATAEAADTNVAVTKCASPVPVATATAATAADAAPLTTLPVPVGSIAYFRTPNWPIVTNKPLNLEIVYSIPIDTNNKQRVEVLFVLQVKFSKKNVAKASSIIYELNFKRIIAQEHHVMPLPVSKPVSNESNPPAAASSASASSFPLPHVHLLHDSSICLSSTERDSTIQQRTSEQERATLLSNSKAKLVSDGFILTIQTIGRALSESFQEYVLLQSDRVYQLDPPTHAPQARLESIKIRSKKDAVFQVSYAPRMESLISTHPTGSDALVSQNLMDFAGPVIRPKGKAKKTSRFFPAKKSKQSTASVAQIDSNMDNSSPNALNAAIAAPLSESHNRRRKRNGSSKHEVTSSRSSTRPRKKQKLTTSTIIIEIESEPELESEAANGETRMFHPPNIAASVPDEEEESDSCSIPRQSQQQEIMLAASSTFRPSSPMVFASTSSNRSSLQLGASPRQPRPFRAHAITNDMIDLDTHPFAIHAISTPHSPDSRAIFPLCVTRHSSALSLSVAQSSSAAALQSMNNEPEEWNGITMHTTATTVTLADELERPLDISTSSNDLSRDSAYSTELIESTPVRRQRHDQSSNASPSDSSRTPGSAHRFHGLMASANGEVDMSVGKENTAPTPVDAETLTRGMPARSLLLDRVNFPNSSSIESTAGPSLQYWSLNRGQSQAPSLAAIAAFRQQRAEQLALHRGS